MTVLAIELHPSSCRSPTARSSCASAVPYLLRQRFRLWFLGWLRVPSCRTAARLCDQDPHSWDEQGPAPLGAERRDKYTCEIVAPSGSSNDCRSDHGVLLPENGAYTIRTFYRMNSGDDDPDVWRHYVSVFFTVH
jgi:hypothetical protein